MTRILRNKKGVTLVELLAVIVILGIIAAIAVPTIGGLINRQRENAALATLESIEFAAVSYADGEDIALPILLTVLETEEFIDLKDNTYEVVVVDGDVVLDGATLVYVTVVGGVVDFWFDDAATEPADFYINGFLVYTNPN